MPKISLDILNEELPSTNKNTISNVSKQENYENTKKDTSISIYDLVKKESSLTKEQVGVTLNKGIVDKLKTVAVDSNMTISKLFETLLSPLLEDIEVNPENVKIYNEKNKAKGRRKKSE